MWVRRRVSIAIVVRRDWGGQACGEHAQAHSDTWPLVRPGLPIGAAASNAETVDDYFATQEAHESHRRPFVGDELAHSMRVPNLMRLAPDSHTGPLVRQP